MRNNLEKIDAILRLIAKTKTEGRPIVPLIGGGVAAETGLPTSQHLVRYFAALQCFVKHRVYLPEVWHTLENNPMKKRVEAYDRSLLEYIRDFQWPDAADLIQSLRKVQTLPRPVDEAISTQLDTLAEKLYPDSISKLRKGFAKSKGNDQPISEWDVVGHWRDLLRYVTEFHPDYAEQLFARLQRSRRPGLSHRYLAFLTNVLGIRLFLTSTVDRLLEQALDAEGIDHRVFILDDIRPFPVPELVRDNLSVLKIHGDVATRFNDYRQTAPWEQDVIKRFRQSYPKDALLLVLGWSGQSTLMMNVIEQVVLGFPDQSTSSSNSIAVAWLHYEQFEPIPLQHLLEKHKERNLAGRIATARINEPGIFLRQVYTALTSRYPASRYAYSSQSTQPTLLDWQDPGEDPPMEERRDGPMVKHERTDGSVVLFTNLRPVQPKGKRSEEDRGHRFTSEKLSKWMNDQRRSFHRVPIWIDLEGLFTLPGIVGVIVDRCRLYDPHLAPSVLPLGGSINNKGEDLDLPLIEKAANRVAEALERGRYALAFDSLEAYIWPHTAHHGTTSAVLANQEPTERRLKEITEFIVCLVNHDTFSKSASLAVSVNLPRSRRATQADEKLNDIIREQVASLIERCQLQHEVWLSPLVSKGNPVTTLETSPKEPYDAFQLSLVPQESSSGREAESAPLTGARARLALLGLACYRRSRSLNALRAFFNPLDPASASEVLGFGPASRVDSLLDWYCQQGYLIPVEGGLYWMNRVVRNEIYSQNSSYTKTETIRRVTAEPDRDVPRQTLEQLLLLSLHHDWIARYYYFDTFVMSHDPLEFFEYVYHRVSSIRYLTKLHLVLSKESVRDDVQQIALALRAAIPEYPSPSDTYLTMSNETLAEFQDQEQLRDKVANRRVREIEGLRLAWNVSREALQKQVSAEQLIGWCRWLIEDDLPRFTTQFYLDPKASAFWKEECRILDRRVEGSILGLLDDLSTLEAQCGYERSDFRSCIWTNTKHLLSWILFLGDYQDSLPEFFAPFEQADIPTECNWDGLAETFPESIFESEVTNSEKFFDSCAELVRYIAASGLGLGLSQSDFRPEAMRIYASPSSNDLTTKGFQEFRLRVVNYFFRIAKCGIGLGQDVGPFLTRVRERLLDPSEREARLDCLHLLADNLVKRVRRTRDRRELVEALESVGAAMDGEAPKAVRSSPEDDLNMLAEAKDAVEKGLVELRHLQSAQAPPIEPPYFPFRSKYLLNCGNLLRLSLEPEQMNRAYQLFELARGTTKGSLDSTWLARIDLDASACAIAHAANLLKDVTPATLRTVEAKYQIAERYLRHAYDHLLQGRRNVVWWKEYARLFCTYKSNKNLLRLVELLTKLDTLGTTPTDEEKANTIQWGKTTARKFLRTLRQGLQTVRRGWDVELRPEPQSWQGRLATEMKLTALFFGTKLLEILRSDLKSQSESILKYWDWLAEKLLLPSALNHDVTHGDLESIERILGEVELDPLKFLRFRKAIIQKARILSKS